MAGNVHDWTIEAGSASNRVSRGGDYFGNYDSDYPDSLRGGFNPTGSNDDIGSRLALYM